MTVMALPHMWLLLVSTAAIAAGAVKAPEEFIDVNTGTANTFDFSRGNVLPESCMPWGFNGFAPVTGGVQGSPDPGKTGGFWFSDRAYRLWGIRLTHQPSPWTGDYGPMVHPSTAPVLRCGRRASLELCA